MAFVARPVRGNEVGDAKAGPHTLGAVVRSLRLSLQLTQEELADRVDDGMAQSDVSQLERGRVKLPRRARLERIAAALGVASGELLSRSGWADADQYFRQAEVSPEPEPDDPVADLHEIADGLSSDPDLARRIVRLANDFLDVRGRSRGRSGPVRNRQVESEVAVEHGK